jgi:hypothetical protein
VYIGYPSSPFLLRPFTDPEVNNQSPAERDRRKKFNRRLSSIRIYVEHAFGILKARFSSLKELGTHDNPQDMYRAVEAMIAVHNLCIDLKDGADDFFDANEEQASIDDLEDVDQFAGYGGVIPEQQANIPAHETDGWLKTEGYRLRLELLDLLFPL